MSFGADCLINKLNTNITGLGATNQTSLDFAQLGGALNSLENSFCSVATINDLPAASDNEGRFIYVTACRSFIYSDGIQWLMETCSVRNAAPALFTWGSNNFGRLGDGTTVSRISPGTVAGGGTTWCQVSGGNANSIALKTDGTLWTWGCGGQGRLGDGTTVNRSSPGTVFGGDTNWCWISIIGTNVAAIKTDGTLWTWGNNGNGQLGDGTTVSRCSPGTVAGAGTNWCQVSAGCFHAAAIKTDGTLWTWGFNSGGQLGNGGITATSSPGTVAGAGTNWCQVCFGGTSNSAAIKCDGTIWTWGLNTAGSLGDGTTVSRVSPGTVAGAGTNWCQVSFSGNTHAAAIKCDGTLWTWGCNSCGSLGDGTLVSRCSPGTIAGGGTNWCKIAGGENFSSALKTDGTLWTWGYNISGRLGDGTALNRCSPGTIAGGGTNWWKVSSGSFHTVALLIRGF